MGMMKGIYCIDGDGRREGLFELEEMHHCEVSDLEMEALPEQGVAVLNLCGTQLQKMLGAFFRQKRPFALLGVDGMDDVQISHLAATSRKRKSHCWLLGALRILPVVAAVKEVVTGGCVGGLSELTVELGGVVAGGHACELLARDTASWLVEGASMAGNGVKALCVPGGSELRVACAGSAGWLKGAYDMEAGAGWLETHVNGHARTRRFGEARMLSMELSLLAALGVKSRDVPGVMPLKDLGDAEKTSK